MTFTTQGYTALHSAANNKHAAVVTALVARGADTAAVDNVGYGGDLSRVVLWSGCA
ncbi:hypothetical protein [Acidovorax sp. BLS4]|uniref:hypothetical protein n=1 Tax=Acidovorax sp. BLS4 TaxID=3273430 RepID=UPI00355B12BC